MKISIGINMYEKVKINNLIKGETYHFYTHDSFEGTILVNGQFRKNTLYYSVFQLNKEFYNFFQISDVSFDVYVCHTAYYPFNYLMNAIYRKVSKNEYCTKLKQKYDHNTLNYILKNLLDETFYCDFL